MYKPRRRRSNGMWAASGGRLLLWALVVAGVGSGMWAMRAVRSIPEPPAAVPVMPMAVSQTSMQFVERWLRASSVEELDEFVKVAASSSIELDPSVPTRVWVADAAPFVRGWEIVVAAEFEVQRLTDDQALSSVPTAMRVTRWYRVEMLRVDDGDVWQIAGLPAAVASPIVVEPKKAAWSDVLDLTDPRLQTVQEWLSAYLTGTTDPTRWLARGAWTPGPPAEVFDSVEVVGAEFEGSAKSPTVTAQVIGHRGGSEVPMTYSVALADRGDRWEITEVFPRSVQH